MGLLLNCTVYPRGALSSCTYINAYFLTIQHTFLQKHKIFSIVFDITQIAHIFTSKEHLLSTLFLQQSNKLKN